MPTEKIAESTIRRLSLYLRFLDEFESGGTDTVSSDDLAAKGGVTPAQVRKDLSLFGSFGKRGLGYPVGELRIRLMEILGLDRIWRVCLVGAGRLGAALYQYDGFRRRGFEVLAVFDVDPEKIGRRWGELEVDDIADLDRVVAERDIEMGIVVTPADAAQEVADGLVEAGVSAILNFAPRRLEVPEEIALRDVNLVVELETLAFALRHRGEIVPTH